MTYKIAVVGATGAVGREMLQTLFERKFPTDKVYALASSKSPGRQVSFGDDEPYNDADKVHNDVAAVTNTNTDDDSDDGNDNEDDHSNYRNRDHAL